MRKPHECAPMTLSRRTRSFDAACEGKVLLYPVQS